MDVMKSSIPRVFFFVVLCFLLQHPAVHAAQRLTEAKVTTVHDGDTVTISMDGRKYRSRLIGIDAPEMGQEPWGRKARAHLRDLLKQSDRQVFVETDSEKFDKYNRLLVYLRLPNGELLNERMILDGYAFRFTIKPNTRYADRFRKAQQRARMNQYGIWGPGGLKERPLDYKKAHPRK
jgi:micrococcal nuclease